MVVPARSRRRPRPKSRAASNISAWCRSTPSREERAGRVRPRFFTLRQARAARGRDGLHARSRAAAEGRRAARRRARTARRRYRCRRLAPDRRQDPRARSWRAKALARRCRTIRRCSRRCMSRWCGSAKPRARSTEILEVLAAERARAEALRRKLGDALRYPAFVLLAAVACCCSSCCSCCRNSPPCCAISAPSSIRIVLCSSACRISCARNGDACSRSRCGADRRRSGSLLRRPKRARRA